MARILVAEDDEQLRNFLVRVLERAGHRVEAAADGAHAGEALADESVDLLIADVTMPGLDGVELAKQVSRGNPDVKIMFITGFAAVALQRGHAGNGTTGVAGLPALSKPFHLNRLAQEVGRLLYS
ncbi:MAG: response regulator [Dongiaceae bacterium]